MLQCKNCFLDLKEHHVIQIVSDDGTSKNACPNCGFIDERANIKAEEVIESKPETQTYGVQDKNIVSSFFANLWKLIFSPTSFFKQNTQSILAPGSVSSALAFALVINWLAAFFNFIWFAILGSFFQSRLSDLLQVAVEVTNIDSRWIEQLQTLQEKSSEFIFGAGAVLLSPFTTLLKLVCVAWLIHLAVRMFFKEYSDRPLRYGATLKVLAYSSAPMILTVIPSVGVLLGYILSFFAAVIGLTEVYKTSRFRASIAVLFPEIIFLVLIFVVIFFVLFFFLSVLKIMF